LERISFFRENLEISFLEENLEMSRRQEPYKLPHEFIESKKKGNRNFLPISAKKEIESKKNWKNRYPPLLDIRCIF
jgi:hypothetical protein